MSKLMTALLLVLFSCACGSAQKSTMGYSDVSYGDEIQAVSADKSGPMRSSGSAAAAPKTAPASEQAKHAANMDRKIVKNAWLDIVVKKEKDIAPAVKQAELIAKRLEGYVTKQTTNSITFKVPNGRLDEALAALAEVGKVKDKSIDAVDVTANYVDLQIRVDNLRKMQKRLQELLEKGQNVQDILEVEKELGRITTQLEALQGRLRLLQNQTTFATIRVQIRERVVPGPLGWVFYGVYHGVKWLFVWD